MASATGAGGPATRNPELIPPDESERIAAVHRYDILDTPPDGAFDRVAALAGRFFNTPIATVTIVDEDRIWFKAKFGLEGVEEIPRDPGLCASAILGDGPYVITDAATDQRALANPLVRGDFGLRFYAAAPIVTSDGHKLGTVNVIDTKPHAEATQDQLDTLQDLASVVLDEMELRIAAVRSFNQERDRAEAERAEAERVGRIARTLRQTLLPETLPLVPGAEIGTFYQAGSPDEVGGDFYDVFQLSGDRWAITVGDVSGKGVEAAVLTALARYTMRGAAVQAADPGEVLAAVSESVAGDQRQLREPRHCTAVYAVVEPSGDGFDVRLANGGHPPAIRLAADGTAKAIGATGPILGWLADARYDTATLHLGPGEAIVLYTDGITDSRVNGDRFGEQAFVGALAGAPDNLPETVVARVKHLLTRFTPASRDDVAVLVLTVPAR